MLQPHDGTDGRHGSLLRSEPRVGSPQLIVSAILAAVVRARAIVRRVATKNERLLGSWLELEHVARLAVDVGPLRATHRRRTAVRGRCHVIETDGGER